MGFDSIFFISCFLPAALALYWLVPGLRRKNWVLLAVSLLFYSFGSLPGTAVLLCFCLVNYCFGLWLCRGRGRKLALSLGICLDLAFLCAYKYLDFFALQLPGLPQLALGLAAPLGISYFVFKSISYLVDTYRDPEQGTGSAIELLLYISFFPQIVMGPITRFGDFRPQLHQRSITTDRTVRGLRRFVAGLAKKLMIASTLGAMTDRIFGVSTDILNAPLAWLGAVGYCLQLYFDFSGYIDMAIGLGWIFGFETVENFHYPYVAKSVGEFWRRWHISLSAWFKDYVYIPLGGNRKGKLRAGVNKAVVFLLCGFWHGAAWTYLLWGAWHGLFSMLESLHLIPAKKLGKSRLAGHVYTLLVVCIGFVIFRASSVEHAFAVIGAMFTGFHGSDAATLTLHLLLTPKNIAALLAGIALSLPVTRQLRRIVPGEKCWETAACIGSVVLYALCLIGLASGNFAPSIYAGF